MGTPLCRQVSLSTSPAVRLEATLPPDLGPSCPSEDGCHAAHSWGRVEVITELPDTLGGDVPVEMSPGPLFSTQPRDLRGRVASLTRRLGPLLSASSGVQACGRPSWPPSPPPGEGDHNWPYGSSWAPASGRPPCQAGPERTAVRGVSSPWYECSIGRRYGRENPHSTEDIK